MSTLIKKISILSIIASFGCCINSAFAADTADMSIHGVLSLSSCTPTVTSPALDYGKITEGELSSAGETQLGSKEFNVMIGCPSVRKVGFTVTDNQHDSVVMIPVTNQGSTFYSVGDDREYFGLGDTATGQHIGAYTLKVSSSAVVDGKTSSYVGVSDDHGDSYHLASPGTRGQGFAAIRSDGNDIFTILSLSKSKDSEPQAFKSSTFTLSVGAAIQSTENISLTDDAQLDGSATLSLVYL